MDSLKIDSGEIRLSVNDDPSRVIAFNPDDTLFAEKFYKIVGEFESKMKEYKTRAGEIDRDVSLDNNGIPANVQDRISLLHEICAFVRERIDYVFGDGTSQTAFGDALNLGMFVQFFSGITPFIQSARSEKIAKYITPPVRRPARGKGRESKAK